jgi:hypothetical protein
MYITTWIKDVLARVAGHGTTWAANNMGSEQHGQRTTWAANNMGSEHYGTTLWQRFLRPNGRVEWGCHWYA